MSTTSPQAILYGQLLEAPPEAPLPSWTEGFLGQHQIDHKRLTTKSAAQQRIITDFSGTHLHDIDFEDSDSDQKFFFSGGHNWLVRASFDPEEWGYDPCLKHRSSFITEMLASLFHTGVDRVSPVECEIREDPERSQYVFADAHQRRVTSTCRLADICVYSKDALAAVCRLAPIEEGHRPVWWRISDVYNKLGLSHVDNLLVLTQTDQRDADNFGVVGQDLRNSDILGIVG